MENHGQSPFSDGKPTISMVSDYKWPCSIAMFELADGISIDTLRVKVGWTTDRPTTDYLQVYMKSWEMGD